MRRGFNISDQERTHGPLPLRTRFFAFLFLGLVSSQAWAAQPESTCFGTPAQGWLQGGVAIPESGPNFFPYSSLGVFLGRTHVHSRVAAVVGAAYRTLASSAPDKIYVYGESGWPEGGRIKPHRTHQNGLAVDFMVPLIDGNGKSMRLPTGITNGFGYSIEFDAKGRYEDLTIDFEAIAEHLHALHQAGRADGLRIKRVIFESTYIPKLYATHRGAFIRASIPFMQTRPWIRHDEHYHVDFDVPCKRY